MSASRSIRGRACAAMLVVGLLTACAEEEPTVGPTTGATGAQPQQTAEPTDATEAPTDEPDATEAASAAMLSATLSGAEEVPGPGSEGGTGTATVEVDGTEVCFELTVEGVDAPNAAHIHEGVVGEAGGVVVGLEALAEGTSSGCVEADPAVAEAIVADPAGFYVNVHNAEFPDGAVRGQLG